MTGMAQPVDNLCIMRGIITLPFPGRKLSPNGRFHWRVQRKAQTAARELAAGLAREALSYQQRKALGEGDGPIPLTIAFYPPDRIRRDRDNLIASCKSLLDGVADALHVNDHRFHPQFEFHEPEKPGRVEIRFA